MVEEIDKEEIEEEGLILGEEEDDLEVLVPRNRVRISLIILIHVGLAVGCRVNKEDNKGIAFN